MQKEARNIKLVGMSGSIRRASYSAAILNSLKERLPLGTSLDVIDLSPMPLYNEDEDGDTAPEIVQEMKRAISQCDGLVVVSPEYNYGISGVLKNAIDWASRPGFKSPLLAKPVISITSSVGITGGVRAQVHLLELFAATLSRVVPSPQLRISSVHEKVIDGRLADDTSISLIEQGIEALLREIRLLNTASEEPH